MFFAGGREQRAFQPCRKTSQLCRDSNNIHNKSRTLMCLTPGALKGLSRQGLQTGF